MHLGDHVIFFEGGYISNESDPDTYRVMEEFHVAGYYFREACAVGTLKEAIDYVERHYPKGDDPPNGDPPKVGPKRCQLPVYLL